LTTLDTAKAETSTGELNRLQAEVEALRKQLQHAQRLAAVGTMTAMVAHEFNNILTPIVNYARLARTNPKLVEKAILRAADGGEKCTHICQAILGLAGGEAKEPQEINLRALISETLTAMAREPKRDAIELEIDAPGDMTITAHPVEIQQVLLNLLINARTAVLAQNGPRRISVSGQRKSDNVTIRVSDTGVGIPPEHMDKIFQPFFSTTSGDDDAGHGLGLAICKEIVSEMNGRISAQSKVGSGTTFTIRLPA